MKKNLLLFSSILCFSLASFAQNFNTPAHLRVCDQDGDGFEIFDLTSTTDEILGDLDPNDYTFSYHTSLADTNANVNPIANPAAYTNVIINQEVYARIAFSNGFGKVKFRLFAEEPTVIGPQYTLAQCDYDGFPGDNLTGFVLSNIEYQISNFNLSFDFYETQADANAETNAINYNEIYYSTTPFQILYLNVTNQLGCISYTEVQLVAVSPPYVNNTVLDLSVCDADSDGFFTTDLTSHANNIIDQSEFYTITYYASSSDFNSNTPIPNPEAYSNTSNPQTIYVTVGDSGFEGTNQECVSYADFQIVADPNCGLIAQCEDDNDGSATFDITEYETTYLNGQNATDFSFQYYLTEADANAMTNAIATPTSFVNTINPQSVYLGATEIANNNYQVVRVSLEVNSNPLVDLGTSFTQCNGETIVLDPNVDTGAYNFMWSTGATTPTISVTSAGDYTLNISGITNTCSYNTTFTVVSAPISANTLAVQEVCGWEVDFDLTSSETAIIGNQTEDLTLSYFNNITDAESGFNAIQNASSYSFNGAGSYTFYVRVDANITDCYVIVPLELSVVDALNVNPAALFECNEPGQGDYVFDLNAAIPVITNGQPYTVTFHETENDANQGVNALSSPYTTTETDQILYTRIENSATCYALSFLQLLGATLQDTFAPSDFVACDDDNDGFTEFNLGLKSNEITGANDPNYFGVQYFETMADAQAGVNPLPLNYTNTTQSIQTIYVRVYSYYGSCYNTTSFNIVVENAPNIPASNTVVEGCYDPVLMRSVFDLDSSIPELINGQVDIVVSFHATQTDAENNTAPLSSPYEVQFPSGVMARLENVVTGCYSLAIVVLQQSGTCIVDITCGEAPLNRAYCYQLDSNRQFVYESSDGSPLQVVFNAGEVEVGYAQLFILDSDGVTNLNTATPYGNSGDLTGLSFTSSGSTMTVYIEPDDYSYYDCDSGDFEPMNYTVFCEDSIGFIEVNAFYDDNNDGMFNANETAFDNGFFTYEINNDGMETVVNSSTGTFTIYNPDEANTYDISLDTNLGYENCYTIPVSLFENISVLHGETTVVNFPVTIQQTCEDVAVYLIPVESPRPGFEYTSHLVIDNVGSTAISSGTVNFVSDALIDLDDAYTDATGTSIDLGINDFDIDFTNLAPQTSIIVYIDLYCPVASGLGDIVTYTASYTTNTNDVAAINDTTSLSQVVIGSYDPNDKYEAHGGRIGIDEFTTDDYLYYTINFQNLGNADALTVRIEDVLDTQLDETSFKMLASSHDYVVTRENRGLTWQFNGINLPPESEDEEESKGFVYFKIKPNVGFVAGDIIPNTADIYFDFNDAIVTNTYNTEFFATLSSNEFLSRSFKIYPNPAQNLVTVSFGTMINEVVNISIYDIQGKLVIETYMYENEIDTQINIENLDNGMYFVKLKSKTFELAKKLIVE